nr:CDK-activating kinase assembly factor MAT1-like [Arachis hypogaea]
MRECPTSLSSSTFDNSSSPKYVSTQTSTSQRFSELESRFNRLVEEQQQSRRELEILFHETDEQLENTEKRLELLSKENEDQLMDAKENVEEQNEEAFELIEDPLQKSRKLLKRQEQLMEKQQQSWKEQEILFKEVDEYLEKGRRNSELLSKEDKDQLASLVALVVPNPSATGFMASQEAVITSAAVLGRGAATTGFKRF